MFKRAVFLSSAIFLGSFSFSHASVSSVVDACGGGDCAAAISAEISNMTPAQANTFLAALAQAAASASKTVKDAISAGLTAAAKDAPSATVAQAMTSMASGIADDQVDTAAIGGQPAGAGQNQGSGN